MIKVERLEARDGLTICDECNARVQNAPYYRVYVGVHTDRLCKGCAGKLLTAAAHEIGESVAFGVPK